MGSRINMKSKLILGLFLAVLISTNVFGQKLIPVEGPIASQPDPPIFTGQIKHSMFSSGGLKGLKSWTVDNGEVLSGKFDAVKVLSVNEKTAGSKESYPPQPNLSFAWDVVQGKKYFSSHVLGKYVWQGVFTGELGTVLQVEIFDWQHGAAVDNRGNIYKVVW
jgi:hypothetical protein